MKSSDKQYNLRIDLDLYAKVEAKAKKERRSVNAEILLAIEAWLRSQA